MAAVPVTISGVLYDLYGRTTQRVLLMGDLSISDVSIGGGPIIPPDKPPGGPPVGIWPNPPEGQAPIPSHPIVLPGDPSWEGPGGIKPPDFQPPPPGSPPVVLPGQKPVQPIVPPPFIVVPYPGVGPVLVPLPATPAAAPTPAKK